MIDSYDLQALLWTGLSHPVTPDNYKAMIDSYDPQALLWTGLSHLEIRENCKAMIDSYDPQAILWTGLSHLEIPDNYKAMIDSYDPQMERPLAPGNIWQLQSNDWQLWPCKLSYGRASRDNYKALIGSYDPASFLTDRPLAPGNTGQLQSNDSDSYDRPCDMQGTPHPTHLKYSRQTPICGSSLW